MLAVLDAGHDLPLGGSVAAQFVGDQHTRRPQLPFQKLAEQAFSGLLVAPALDQNVENEALLVDRTPEPVLRAGDRDDEASGAGQLQPRALSEPDVILSHHPAPIVRPLP
jgi:hypothetical protein